MQKNGFTLVELICYVALILLIMGIAIPSAVNLLAKKDKQQNDRVDEIIDTSIENYIAVNYSTISECLPYYITIKDLIDARILDNTVFSNAITNDTTYIIKNTTDFEKFNKISSINNVGANVGNYIIVNNTLTQIITMNEPMGLDNSEVISKTTLIKCGAGAEKNPFIIKE